ncbi:hypothetical protein [Nicoliella lavandulae]|uniref:Uncharacterized protein n=1 Tax=Nicoliella lavandulae TaxID=3082954 RepID=A0ABU8SP29_9LACO
MEIFIIDLYAIASAIWLIASFSHFIIAWYEYSITNKTTTTFWREHGFGIIILLIAFIVLWIIHLPVFTTNPPLLEFAFMIAIIVGIPTVKQPMHQLYINLKNYEE